MTLPAQEMPSSESAKPVVRRGLIYRRILELLAEQSPIPRRQVLDKVAASGELTEYETQLAGQGRGPRWETFATFGSTEMRAAGWLEKQSEGWSITDAGRAALATYEGDDEQLAKDAYSAWKKQDQAKKQMQAFDKPAYQIVDAALALVEAGYWTSFTDLAQLAGLTPSQVGTYVGAVRNEAGHRVLQSNGRAWEGKVEVDGQLWERQEALVREGLAFDERNVADLRTHITVEDLREQLESLGVLMQSAQRAWLVRGSSVNGRDLVPVWRERGSISLAATKLRSVESGLTREALKDIVAEDYSQASYASKAAKVDEFHAFLTRMHEGDIVVTTSQGRLYLGTIIGNPTYVASEDGRSNLRRPVKWMPGAGVDYADLPGEISARLQVQHEVVEMTEQLDLLDRLRGLDVTKQEEKKETVTRELVLPDATQDLAARLHVGFDWLQESIQLLRERQQLIYYGPPGTGKTFIALKLAEHLAGDNVRLVQFHPAYTYEDFFEGYRPVPDGGFELKPGPLRKIVDQAKENPSTPYFLIIDEINRGNLAKIFGELYFLLEYRDRDIDLLYATDDNVGFTLPKNVFFIGTMNTADRSIALVHSAMRRRFAFEALHPSYKPTAGLLRRWLKAEGHSEEAADLLDALNERIEDPDFKIGPSYFMKKGGQTSVGIKRVWRTAIMPLLEEHHYGDLSAAEVEKRYGLDVIRARVKATLVPVGATAEEPSVVESEPEGESTDAPDSD